MSLFDAPAGPTLDEHAAHLGRLHAADQHDPETVSPRTLDAVAAVLAERDQMVRLVSLVRQMRTAQRGYFRTKGGLSDCKALESRVDALLRQV